MNTVFDAKIRHAEITQSELKVFSAFLGTFGLRKSLIYSETEACTLLHLIAFTIFMFVLQFLIVMSSSQCGVWFVCVFFFLLNTPPVLGTHLSCGCDPLKYSGKKNPTIGLRLVLRCFQDAVVNLLILRTLPSYEGWK